MGYFRKIINIAASLMLIVSVLNIGFVSASGQLSIEIADEALADSAVTIDAVSAVDGIVTLSGTVKDGSKSVTLKIFDSENELRFIGQAVVDTGNNYSVLFDISRASLGTFTAEIKTTSSEKKEYTFSVQDVYAELEYKLNGLSDMISECEAGGLSVEYEKLGLACAYRVLEVLNEIGRRTDGNENDDVIVSYNIEVIRDIIAEISPKLKAYIAGTASPVEAVLTGNTALSAHGKTFYNAEGRPVFLNGYCPGWESRDDIENYSSFGTNVIAQVIPLKSIIGERNAPAGWTEQGGSAGWADAELLTTRETAYEGESSLKIVNRTAATTNVTKYIYRYIDLEPSTTYVMSAYLKGNTKNVTINVGSGSNQGRISEDMNYSDWTYRAVEFTTDSNGLSNALMYIGSSNTTSAFYVDNFSLVKKGTSKNLIENGDFEDYYAGKEGEMFGVSQKSLDSYRQKYQQIKNAGLYVVASPAFHDIDTFGFLLRQEGVKGSGETYSVYMKANPTNPIFLKAIDVYLENVIPVLEEFDNVVGFQIANEPRFNAYAHAYYVSFWQEYLENKYTDISSLNTAYGSSYSSFDEISMPSSASKTVRYYDYVTFNESIMEQFHTHVAETIRSVSPDIPIFTKAMIEFTSQVEPASYTYGINYENSALSGYFSYNGNDAWAYLGNSYNTLQAMLMWYDVQTSVKNSPVLNLENHYILDNSTVVYNAKTPAWYKANLWQGAIHGSGLNLTWLFGISDSTNASFRNPTIQYRADVMYESGKVTYDLNRLSDKIAALQNKECDVALLHSHTTSVYNYQHENSLYKTYTSLLYRGYKPFIANEYDIEKINNYDILIIPEATHVSNETVNAITAYSQSGGKVYMFGSDSLSYNTNGIARSSNMLSGLNTQKVYAATRNVNSKTSSISSSISSYVDEIMGENELTVTNNSDGSATSDIEITYVISGDSLILNLCNYNSSAKTVNVNYKGVQLEGGTELISGTEAGSTVTLEQYKPVLIEYKNIIKLSESFSLVDDNGNVIEADIKAPSTGNIHYSAELRSGYNPSQLRLIIAQYNIYSKKVKSVAVFSDMRSSIEGTLKVSELSSGDIIKVFIWDKDGMRPVTETSVLSDGGVSD